MVICGLKGYKRKCERRHKEGKGFYRSAKQTLGKRVHKKLMEKTSWFKDKRRDEHDEQEDRDQGKGAARSGGEAGSGSRTAGSSSTVSRKDQKAGGGGGNQVKSVIFVPHTPGSALAKNMREGEIMLEKTTGYKMKIVERAGDSLENLLHRSNPWAGADCGREMCLLCESKQTHKSIENQNCHKRNVVYEMWCETCRQADEKEKPENDKKEIKMHKYIGESSRSCHERGFEHQQDCEQLKPGSHMLKHILDKHEGKQPGEIKFHMKAIRFHKSAYERQVHESVMIKENSKGHYILNSRAEYNRCALPRLGTKLGEKETKEKRLEVEAEEKKEQELEEKIKNMRKERQRLRRSDRQPNQPQRKKQRIEKEENEALEILVQEMKRGEKRRQQSIEDSLEQARKRQRKDEQAEHQSSNEEIKKADRSPKLREEVGRAEQLCCAEECPVQSPYGLGRAEQQPGGKNGQWPSEESKPTPNLTEEVGWAEQLSKENNTPAPCQAEQKSSPEKSQKSQKAKQSPNLSEEIGRAEQLCCADECTAQSSYGPGRAEQQPGEENGQWLSEEAKPTPNLTEDVGWAEQLGKDIPTSLSCQAEQSGDRSEQVEEFVKQIVEEMLEESSAFVELQISCGTVLMNYLSPPKPPPDRGGELREIKSEILRIQSEISELEARRELEQKSVKRLKGGTVKSSTRKVRHRNVKGVEPIGKNRNVWKMQQEIKKWLITTPSTTKPREMKLEQRKFRDGQKSLGGTVPPSNIPPNCQTQSKPNKSPRTPKNVKSEEKVKNPDSCNKGEGGTSGNHRFVASLENQQSGPRLEKTQKVNKISKLKNFWENKEEMNSHTKSICVGPMGVVRSRLVLNQPTTEEKGCPRKNLNLKAVIPRRDEK